MRIAMVSEHASPLAALGGVDAGGQNVHVAALAEAVARCGASVVVHTRRDAPDLPERQQMSPGVEVHHVDAGPSEQLPKDALLPHMDAFADRLAESWSRERPDVVHSHFWMSAYAALRAAGPLAIPVVHTFHALGVVKRRYQGDRDTSPPERLAIERDIARRVDQIVATCTDEVFELVRMGVPSARVTVIPCGVDMELFRPDGPADERRPGFRRLVSVGRLVERKGIGNVISALARVRDTELVIAGGPDRAGLRKDPEARRLVSVVEESGVADRVELRGRLDREEVPLLLRSADAVVAVPWYEPFGIVPLEGMACGVPIVASAVGGMIDTVVDGVTGLHVPPRDPDRLAAALRGLLDDPELRKQFGEAGVERARRLFDWNRVAAATLDVYARHARGRPARRQSRRMGRFRLPPTPAEHLAALTESLHRLEGELDRLASWGERLARRLADGGRLLAVGNGGSAAHAQHLTAELVGRYLSDRDPLSAICLHGDAFAQQVRAHGSAGDVLLTLSTSGASLNVLAAAQEARGRGLETWALAGAAPNPLTEVCDDCIAFGCASTATVQELHQVALHVICGAVDRELAVGRRREVLV